jgi:hypothetical protein
MDKGKSIASRAWDAGTGRRLTAATAATHPRYLGSRTASGSRTNATTK